jgi:hypothetical protein
MFILERFILAASIAVLHQESPSYLHDLIKIKDIKYCFRYDNITEIPSVRTTRYGLKSFRYAAAKL